jgi:hypothetical protein
MTKTALKITSFIIFLTLVYVLSFGITNDGWTIRPISAEEESVHPENWIQFHGKEYVVMPDLCTTCHDDDLSGGLADMPCDLCHISPKHPENWKEEHGQEYLKDKSQCTTCHGNHPFDGSKKPMSMNCQRCHSINSDISKWQSESHTSHVFINFDNDLQINEDSFGNTKFTSNNYFGLHFSERSKQISFTSQFRFNREWIGETQGFDIFEANLQIDNLFKNTVTLNLGRQAFLSNTDFYLVDGVSAYISPFKWFDFYVFAGIPRFIEDSDVTGDIGFASGFSWILEESNYTNARFDFVYQDRDIDNSNTADAADVYIAGSASKGIGIFKLYGLSEYNLTDKLVQTGTFGAEAYPFTKKIGFLLEGSYFNETRNDTLETVFEIFSIDSLWQFKSGVFIDFIKNTHLYHNFAYQRYQVLDGQSRNGWNIETGIIHYLAKLKLEASLAHYFIKSYGGTLHGIKGELNEDWSRRIYSNLILDYITYEKVTNDNNNGLNLIFKNGLNVFPGISVDGSVEYLVSDVLVNDLRGIFRVNYLFDKKFLAFDKRKELKEKETK